MPRQKKSSSAAPPDADLQNAIRKRAEGIFYQSGQLAGNDLENWQRAEAEILRESGAQLTRPAIVINLDGVLYTGEYDLRTCGDYMPGEWKAGDRVPVRLEGDRLFLRRPNGRELETYVIKRIG
ncbi:MAG: DUF2934 domain-containing protein [Candidatus Sulfotelmatobacter sp.]|jgi:hypothetical protein